MSLRRASASTSSIKGTERPLRYCPSLCTFHLKLTDCHNMAVIHRVISHVGWQKLTKSSFFFFLQLTSLAGIFYQYPFTHYTQTHKAGMILTLL